MRLAKRLKNVLRRFIRECCGPTATEYAVLLVLIVFGALAAISLLGSFVGGSVQSTAQALPSGASEEGSEGDSGGCGSKERKRPPRRRGRGGGRPVAGCAETEEHRRRPGTRSPQALSPHTRQGSSPLCSPARRCHENTPRWPSEYSNAAYLSPCTGAAFCICRHGPRPSPQSAPGRPAIHTQCDYRKARYGGRGVMT